MRTLTRSCLHHQVDYIPLHFHPKLTNRIHSNARAQQGSNRNTSAWLESLIDIVDESKRLLIILKRRTAYTNNVLNFHLVYSIGKEERHWLPNEPQIARTSTAYQNMLPLREAQNSDLSICDPFSTRQSTSTRVHKALIEYGIWLLHSSGKSPSSRARHKTSWRISDYLTWVYDSTSIKPW